MRVQRHGMQSQVAYVSTKVADAAVKNAKPDWGSVEYIKNTKAKHGREGVVLQLIGTPKRLRRERVVDRRS